VSVRLVADDRTRAALTGVGALYVRSRALRCCGGRQHVLETSLADDGGAYVERGRIDGTCILVREGLRLPDELHLALDRHGRIEAFWDGQGWIG
jgi:hypothetical protein